MRASGLFVCLFVFSWALWTPVVQAQSLITTAQVDADNESIVLIGSNLGPNPEVFMGNETGALDQLNVTNSGPNYVVADLLTTAPGTYVVLVINGPSAGFSNVTIGPRATTDSLNTALGIAALGLNTTGSENTAVGRSALLSNTEGNRNTAVGGSALSGNTTGFNNTATGAGTLFSNTTGHGNTATGDRALVSNTTGIGNTATGAGALFSNTSGHTNTAMGANALFVNASGFRNTAIGGSALLRHTDGFSNTAIGYRAGINATTGDNNIYINNEGQTGDSGAIAVGEQGVQTDTSIAGISGATTGLPGSTVLIDANGQLGTTSSSRRFKQDIHDMGEASSGLMSLRPVTFRYKKAYADGEQPLQYGLIAEEVAEVYPELVVKNDKGKVQTVQYHKLNSMLLNEVRKQHQQIQALTKRLARLEEALTAPPSSASVAE